MEDISITPKSRRYSPEWKLRRGTTPDNPTAILESANGPEENSERGNGQMLKRQRGLFRLRGSQERFCGTFLDAKRSEIKLHGALLAAHVQHDKNGFASAGILPQKGQHVGIITIQGHAASIAHVSQGRLGLAQFQKTFVKREN